MNGERWTPTLLVGSVLLFGGLMFPASGGETEKRDQASIVASEVSTISYLLAVRAQPASGGGEEVPSFTRLVAFNRTSITLNIRNLFLCLSRQTSC
jgi:hypothetical protein